MKINRDVADAVLMLSIITLVLIGTTEFNNPSTKTLIMSILGILAVVSGVCRILWERQQ